MLRVLPTKLLITIHETTDLSTGGEEGSCYFRDGKIFLTFSLFKYMYAGRFIVSPSTSYDKWSNFKLRLGDKFCFPLFTNFYNSSKELECSLHFWRSKCLKDHLPLTPVAAESTFITD